MADSVRFPPSIGGSGRTYTNDANPDTGLFNGGHRTNLFPMLEDTVQAAGYVSKYAQAIDGAARNADRAADSQAYVEGYAAALRSNLIEDFAATAAVDIDGVRAEYRRSGVVTQRSDIITELFDFSRASSRWSIDSTGQLSEVPSGTPSRRFQSASGENLGIAIVGAKTNMLPHSADFNKGNWFRRQVTVTEYGPSPFPDQWSRISITQGGGGYLEWRNIPGAAGRWGVTFIVRPHAGSTLWTFGAIHVGETEGDSSYVDIDLVSGEISDYSDPVNRLDDVRLEALTGGGYIVMLSFTTTELCREMRPRISGTSAVDSVTEALLCGVQFQSGYPSDYIPTDGSAVTTAGDQLVVSGHPVDARRGTILLDYVMNQMEGGNTLIDIYGGGLRVSYSSANSLITSGAFAGVTVYNGGLHQRKRLVISIDSGAYKIFHAGRRVAQGTAEFSNRTIRLPGINTAIRRFIHSPLVISESIAKELSA